MRNSIEFIKFRTRLICAQAYTLLLFKTIYVSNVMTKTDFDGAWICVTESSAIDCKKGIAYDWSTTVSASHSARIGIHFLFPRACIPMPNTHSPHGVFDGKLREKRGNRSHESALRGEGKASYPSWENGPFSARWNMDRLLLAYSIRRGASEGEHEKSFLVRRYDRGLIIGR